jgi:hypothetical protein
VAAGARTVRTGDLVVLCKPVAVAAAVVRRDGRVQAVGHPADHVRKGKARRAMTAALAIWLVLLMTLMPGSC